MKAIITILFSLNILANCPLFFPSENLCGEVIWKDAPKLNVDNSFDLVLWDAQDANKELKAPTKDIEIFSWMIMTNGHSHGGPTLIVKNPSIGLYTVDNAKFFMHGMKGRWQIKITLSEYGDITDEAAQDITFE